jgi:hypothetical protein
LLCRKSPLTNGKRSEAEFSTLATLAAMKLQTKGFMCILGMQSAATLVHATALANDSVAPAAATANSCVTPSTRYGLFNGLDQRSWYSEGNFPEPFLVDDTGLEINEGRLDWLSTGANSQHRDVASAEVEKGFGLTTLEFIVPYERDASSARISRGIGNIEVGARHPLYQFVSRPMDSLTPRWGRCWNSAFP